MCSEKKCSFLFSRRDPNIVWIEWRMHVVCVLRCSYLACDAESYRLLLLRCCARLTTRRFLFSGGWCGVCSSNKQLVRMCGLAVSPHGRGWKLFSWNLPRMAKVCSSRYNYSCRTNRKNDLIVLIFFNVC